MNIYYKKPAVMRDTGLLTNTQQQAIARFNKSQRNHQNYRCICGKDSNEGDYPIADQDRFGIDVHIWLCSRCGMIRANPYYDESTLSIFYEHIYRTIYDPNASPLDIYPGQVDRGHAYLQLLKELSLDFSSVLEIGCAAGGMLVPFDDAGFNCTGYDFDVDYLEYGRSRNPKINLQRGGVAEIIANNEVRYDLIMLSHVIEHIPNCDTFLQDVKSLMHEDSILLLSVPGNSCIFSRPAYRFDYRWYLVNAHCWYFSEEHLEFLFRKAGFETTYISEGGIYGAEDIIGVFQWAHEDPINTIIPPPNLTKKNRNLILKSKIIQLPLISAGYRFLFKARQLRARVYRKLTRGILSVLRQVVQQ